MVEHTAENRGVAGSIPALATTPFPASEALVAFARDLIAIPTENPPGAAYEECVGRIGDELETLGLEYELVSTGDDDTPRHAILAAAGADGPLVYLHGHYDVVPAFSPDQFRPRVEAGRLVGRGASDMKGGLAAIVYAAHAATALDARVGLVIVPDEETGGQLGAERLAALERIDKSAAGAIVAEATWGTIWHACRGAFTVQVEVRGKAAHVGLHYEGVNAFTGAVEAVNALDELQRTLRDRRSALAFASTDPRAAESIMLVGGVASGGTGFNIVPDVFSFTIDRRPNADEDYEEAKRELFAVLTSVKDRGIDLEWKVLQDAESAATPAGSAFVTTVAAACAATTGVEPTATCCPGVLETRIYSRLGIPAVAFGPGLIERMHTPDEDVPVANLIAAAQTYARVAAVLTEAR